MHTYRKSKYFEDDSCFLESKLWKLRNFKHLFCHRALRGNCPRIGPLRNNYGGDEITICIIINNDDGGVMTWWRWWHGGCITTGVDMVRVSDRYDVDNDDMTTACTHKIMIARVPNPPYGQFSGIITRYLVQLYGQAARAGPFWLVQNNSTQRRFSLTLTFTQDFWLGLAQVHPQAPR